VEKEYEGLNSASHGAGRKMSRTKALGMLTKDDLQTELKKAQVTHWCRFG
jgi:tRNA-splicing ligase RtcB